MNTNLLALLVAFAVYAAGWICVALFSDDNGWKLTWWKVVWPIVLLSCAAIVVLDFLSCDSDEGPEPGSAHEMFLQGVCGLCCVVALMFAVLGLLEATGVHVG